MSNNGLNLANLLRPRRLEDVKGQAQTTDVLRSQMKKGRLSGNYVFAGKYGCGKTTAARIVAMAMTCDAPDENGEPCGKCESCRAIMDYGSNINVMEVNAASNRGIDNIRDIIERIQTPPAGGAAKRVVILDEAHMLTAEASNALLKTLEEPPEWVSFILCTTEAERIIPTIKSRCQCFRFEPVSERVMAETVKEVLEGRGMAYEEKAVKLLSHLAAGSFRDCLSSLEQCMDALTTGDVLSADMVCNIKGVASLDAAYEFMCAYLTGDTARVMELVSEARISGVRAASYADSVMEMVLSGKFEASGRHRENGYDMSMIKVSDMEYLLNMLKEISDVRAKMNAFSEPFIQLMAVAVSLTMKVPVTAVQPVVKAAEIREEIAPVPEKEDVSEEAPEEMPLAEGFEEFKEGADLPFGDDDEPPFEEEKDEEPVAEQTGKKKMSVDDFFGKKAKAPEKECASNQKLCEDTEGSDEGSGANESDAEFDWGF